MFEVIEHTADIGFRVRAADRETLFVEAARALFSLIVANLDQVRGVQETTLEIPFQTNDYLLFDWLNELLYCYETQHLLLSDFRVVLDGSGLRATCRGELLDADRHPLEHEVKAITYHELKVQATDDGWLAEVIVDI